MRGTGAGTGTVGLESHHIVFWSALHRMDFGSEMDKMRWALACDCASKGSVSVCKWSGKRESGRGEEEMERRRKMKTENGE